MSQSAVVSAADDTTADPRERLGDVAARLDAERFVGRASELAVIESLIAGDRPQRIVYVHGPAGIGKSGLLRAAARLASALGRRVHTFDGRTDLGDVDSLSSDLSTAASEPDPVVIIDEFDQLVALRFKLRDVILAELSAASVVVLAGRQRPAREWTADGLEHIVSTIELAPLAAADAADLLIARGVARGERLEHLVAWAGGYPLALSLAAATSARAAGIEMIGRVSLPAAADPAASVGERRLAEQLLDHLAGSELDGIDPAVLHVAAIAPLSDARLLAAVLRGQRTRTAWQQLRQLSIAEPVGTRVALHRLMRKALLARMRLAAPDRHRALVLRVADHLRDRASAGETEAMVELGDLIENPGIRLGSGASSTHYGDILRPGDLETAAALMGCGETAWWSRFVRWSETNPAHVWTVRRSSGVLSLITIFAWLVDAPAWATREIEVGPMIEHARSRGILAESLMLIDIHFVEPDLDAATRAEVVRVGNMSFIRRSGATAARYILVNYEDRTVTDGGAELGYVEVEALRRRDRERSIETWVVDYGPGGVIGGLHDIIRAEQGEVAARHVPSDPSAALIAALRTYRDPAALAAGSLGIGEGAARVDTARAAVRAAIERTFESSDRDRLLRQLTEWTYIDPDGGRSIAMQRANTSRSAFYRSLKEARARIAASAADLEPDRS
ncbi:MAG: hypothetical protein JWM34_2049 [Ilumatobacteraceae bacterium]|nr:hypothetical protein [Ilumatobacteraceae bacterium]